MENNFSFLIALLCCWLSLKNYAKIEENLFVLRRSCAGELDLFKNVSFAVFL